VELDRLAEERTEAILSATHVANPHPLNEPDEPNAHSSSSATDDAELATVAVTAAIMMARI